MLLVCLEDTLVKCALNQVEQEGSLKSGVASVLR